MTKHKLDCFVVMVNEDGSIQYACYFDTHGNIVTVYPCKKATRKWYCKQWERMDGNVNFETFRSSYYQGYTALMEGDCCQ